MHRDVHRCQECNAQGRLVAAKEMHHVNPPNQADSEQEAYQRTWDEDGLVACACPVTARSTRRASGAGREAERT